MRTAFIQTVVEHVEAGNKIVVISGDAGIGVFEKFQQDHPDCFWNSGIAEQNAISMAAGLALTGIPVCVYNIIPFLLYRCFEQVRNDICYQQLPITLVGTGAGLAYAPAGMTHYSVEDLNLARSLPNLTVLSPFDPISAKAAVRYAFSANKPCYVRLAKSGEPNLATANTMDITQAQLLVPGEEMVLFCHGSIAQEVVKAAKRVQEQGFYPAVVAVPQVQPINLENLRPFLKKGQQHIVIEEHFTHSGLGASLLLALHVHEESYPIRIWGVQEKFIHEVKTPKGMYQHFGIDADSLVRRIMEYR